MRNKLFEIMLILLCITSLCFSYVTSKDDSGREHLIIESEVDNE